MSASLEALKKRLQQEVTPLDIAAAILYFFGETEFPANYEKLNRAFYNEKDNALLHEFRFLERGVYPYSELLDSVLSRLSISGLLGCQNPDYRQFFLRKKQLERIEKGSLKKFTPEQIIELRAVSGRILANLKQNNAEGPTGEPC